MSVNSIRVNPSTISSINYSNLQNGVVGIQSNPVGPGVVAINTANYRTNGSTYPNKIIFSDLSLGNITIGPSELPVVVGGSLTLSNVAIGFELVIANAAPSNTITVTWDSISGSQNVTLANGAAVTLVSVSATGTGQWAALGDFTDNISATTLQTAYNNSLTAADYPQILLSDAAGTDLYINKTAFTNLNIFRVANSGNNMINVAGSNVSLTNNTATTTFNANTTRTVAIGDVNLTTLGALSTGLLFEMDTNGTIYTPTQVITNRKISKYSNGEVHAGGNLANGVMPIDPPTALIPLTLPNVVTTYLNSTAIINVGAGPYSATATLFTLTGSATTDLYNSVQLEINLNVYRTDVGSVNVTPASYRINWAGQATFTNATPTSSTTYGAIVSSFEADLGGGYYAYFDVVSTPATVGTPETTVLNIVFNSSISGINLTYTGVVRANYSNRYLL